jgi:hypothetical protein
MILKLYHETKILINPKESKIVITRGYWNFIQTSLDFSDMIKKDKKELIDIFSKLQIDGQIDDACIKDEFKKEFEQLIAEKLLYSTTEKRLETKSLFITDIPEYLKKKFDNDDNIIYYPTTDFNNDFFNNLNINELYHDPLLKNKIQEKLDIYLKKNNIDIVFVILLSVNDSFCSILNHLVQKKIVFAFFDNDLIYLFGTELKYTGCYSCFSKGMEARRTQEYFDYSTQCSYVSFPEKKYLLDFLLAIIELNLSEYIQNDILPIFGRICTIFTLTLEIRYENLLRSSFCQECGFINLMENKERNFNLKNFLKDIVK